MSRFVQQIKSLSGLFALIWLAVLSSILLLFYAHADKQLSAATKNLRTLGHQYIDYTLELEDSIPLHTFININGRSPIDIQMNIKDSMPIAMNVHFKDSFQIPVDIRINDLISIDTTVTFPNPFRIDINTTIPVAQKMKVVSLAGMNLKVKADLPVDQTMQAAINEPVHIVSAVPVDLNVVQHIPIKLDLHIPIKEKIGIHLPINEKAYVSFPKTLPISGFVPIHLKIKVSIPIAETPIKKYLDSTADHLDGLLRLPLLFR